jgi:hypothetical protein
MSLNKFLTQINPTWSTIIMKENINLKEIKKKVRNNKIETRDFTWFGL